jgi:hypothetical protein
MLTLEQISNYRDCDLKDLGKADIAFRHELVDDAAALLAENKKNITAQVALGRFVMAVTKWPENSAYLATHHAAMSLLLQKCSNQSEDRTATVVNDVDTIVEQWNNDLVVPKNKKLQPFKDGAKAILYTLDENTIAAQKNLRAVSDKMDAEGRKTQNNLIYRLAS